MINFQSPKDPLALVLLTFDFTGMLASSETITSVTSVTVSTRSGGDQSPSAILNGVNGTPTIDTTGKLVYVAVQGGTDGCDYAIKVLAQSSNPLKAPVIDGVLQVRT